MKNNDNTPLTKEEFKKEIDLLYGDLDKEIKKGRTNMILRFIFKIIIVCIIILAIIMMLMQK